MTTKPRSSGRDRETSFEPVRRILFLYNLLRRTAPGRKLTAQRARDNMASSGLEVSLRTVQRYLEVCETFFAGVRRDDSTPNGWWWEENTIDDAFHISKEGALALCLAEAHLKHLIPSNELKHLLPLFQHARKTVEHGGDVNRYKRMLERIWIFPKGLQLIPPKINSQLFDAIMAAILDSNEIQIVYKKSSDPNAKERCIEPLGMVERSGVYYLVGREKYSQSIKNWALHRISSVKQNLPFSYPKEFKIVDWVKSGALNIQFEPRTIELTIKLSESAGAHLFESMIAADQKTTALADGRILVCCTVQNSIELRWWLMSMAHECEVVEPIGLRQEIHQFLEKALTQYDPNRKLRAG